MDIFFYLVRKIQQYFIFRPNEKSTFSHPINNNLSHTFGYINNEVYYSYFHTQSLRKVILYFHGNTGPSRPSKLADIFNDLGYDTFIISYRGYNRSAPIDITEQSLYEDAESAIEYILEIYNPEDIVVYGCSLGTGIASYISSRYNISKLILEAPYYSFVSLIQSYVPIPKSLVYYKFKTYKNLLLTKCPIYILHGTDDTIIDISHSYDLERLCNRLYVLEGAKHNDLKLHPDYISLLQTILC